MAPAKPNQEDQSDSGHLVHRLAGFSGAHTSMGQSIQPQLLSSEFTSQGTLRRTCKYRHECLVCGGTSYSAYPGGRQKGNGKHGNGGGQGNLSGKGAQPHKTEGAKWVIVDVLQRGGCRISFWRFSNRFQDPISGPVHPCMVANLCPVTVNEHIGTAKIQKECAEAHGIFFLPEFVFLQF